MLPSIWVSLLVVTVGTLATSYAMTKASNRSGIWNISVGAAAVLIAAIVLAVVAAMVVRSVFPEFYSNNSY